MLRVGSHGNVTATQHLVLRGHSIRRALGSNASNVPPTEGLTGRLYLLKQGAGAYSGKKVFSADGGGLHACSYCPEGALRRYIHNVSSPISMGHGLLVLKDDTASRWRCVVFKLHQHLSVWDLQTAFYFMSVLAA